jgi:hypothetical protein
VAEREEEAEILGAVIARVEPADVAERMVARFRSEIAGYRRLPEPVVAGQIYEICRQNVELFFRSILEDREPGGADLEEFRESARARAGEGMPLEDLLHAYRLGGRMGWQAITEAARDDERTALLGGAERLMDYVDRVSAAVAQAYLDERQHVVSEEERQLRELFDTLVCDGPVSAGLQELAETVGFPLLERYRPFSLSMPGAGAYEHAQMAESLRARGLLALTEGDRVSGLDAGDGASLPADSALVAVGEPTARSDLPDALDELRLLGDLGRRLGRRGRLEPDAFLAELLLARSPRLAEMAYQRALGPLVAYAERRESDLIDTLAAFLECDLDRRRAAERLHVHPNTLDYRLRRVEELTQLDLSHPDDLVLTTLALKQRALGAAVPDHKAG